MKHMCHTCLRLIEISQEEIIQHALEGIKITCDSCKDEDLRADRDFQDYLNREEVRWIQADQLEKGM